MVGLHRLTSTILDVQLRFEIFVIFLVGQRKIKSRPTYYSDLVINKVKPAVMRKRSGFLHKGVILLRDNARSRTGQLHVKPQ